MTASPIPNAKARFFDRTGAPLAGGKLYTYVAGSVNTNKATYKDYNKVATNTNPVVLDAYGEADIWLDGNYKLYLTDSSNVAQWAAPIDNVTSISTLQTSYTTTGTPNAYILTPSPAITTYTGSSFTIIASFTNTGPATLNVNGLGAVSLVKGAAVPLVSGDMVSGQVYIVVYDGTNFQVANLVTTTFTNLTVTGLATFADIKVIDSINDTNNNEVIIVLPTASAVNEVTVTNAATTTGPTIAATGGDTNIDLNITAKGTGVIKVKGTATAPAEVRLFEQTTNGTNYISLLAPASIASDVAQTLPAAAGTLINTSNLATQADQETATSTTTYVTPGRQQYHPSAAKAWAKVTGSTGAIVASYNIASVSRVSTGEYTVTFTTAFSSGAYVMTGSGQRSSSGLILPVFKTGTTPGVSSCTVQTFNSADSIEDSTFFCIDFYGDQ